jgi:hypothetical protein
MSRQSLDHLLGISGRDPGCERAFEQFDQYCDAVSRGEPVAERFAEFLTHLHNCPDCREDAEGLLAVLQQLENPE